MTSPVSPESASAPAVQPIAVDRDDITPYYEALAAALDGDGPALAPYAADTAPPTALSAQVPELGSMSTEIPDHLALVISTSGSTGTPKLAMLTREALVASALATHERLGGAGTWLLPLPPHHIAGTQVIVRSMIAGTTPIVMSHWSLDLFTKATTLVARNAPPFSPIYTSLVPTQLRDILSEVDGAPAALAAAKKYRAILVGGSATAPDLLAEARQRGLKITTTYGSSETAGGCVYDGVPLEGTSVHILDDDLSPLLSPLSSGVGRVAISGPSLASGYLGDSTRTSATFITLQDGMRAYLTDDLGSFDGTLTIEGRADDIINTGGYKVAPRVVEEVLLTGPSIKDAVAIGIPHPRWGQAVAVAVVLRSPETPFDQVKHEILDATNATLPPYAVPCYATTLASLPLKGVGKPDRTSIAAIQQWQAIR